MQKEYEELLLDGSNYLTWASDIKIVFASRGILSTIGEPVENGSAITEQDFKSIDEYNHAVHNICTRLKFCEKKPTNAEKIYKALSSMHPTDRVLCNQYCKERYTVYSRLIHSLSQTERNDELLLKNHHLRPVGSAPLPEVYNVQNHAQNKRKQSGPPPKNAHNSCGGCRKNRNFIKNSRHKANKKSHKNAPPTRDNGRFCHKCGSDTHFAATRRIPKHLVDLYLKSVRDAKQRENKYEAQFNQTTEAVDLPSMDNMFIEYNSNDMFGDLS
ncbi:hypothetical protein BS78_08G096900 [Paspalum vaginatum]|nr:hypothetical protein BS78_08G096900 [Paspalum vaginatum]